MKINLRIFHHTLGAISLFTGGAAFAQVAPAPTPGSTTPSGEIVTLTPFEVNTSADTGYTAVNTLAGSRLNTSLKDTAASLSVLTAEFLSDIGANSLEEAMAWSTNSQPDVQDTSSFASGTFDQPAERLTANFDF